MRVKSVPRQRMGHGNKNVEPVSEIMIAKSDKFSRENRVTDRVKNESDERHRMSDNEGKDDDSKPMKSVNSDVKVKEEGSKEAVDYSTEALDMTIKHKNHLTQTDSSDPCSIAGPSSTEYEDRNSSEELETTTVSNDDNNNILGLRSSGCCYSACSSSYLRFMDEDSINHLSDEEAVNLCKKDQDEKDDSTRDQSSDGKLKDSCLYKIMTDPTFLENIQKHKMPKKYFCQFCKEEFNTGEDLACHMDVKKDESNQVVCCACKKTFAQKRYLRYHQRCHSERAKFTCDICTKKYTRLDNLTRHNAFHMNPDKFACTFCEKAFARKDLLNKHLKCHDNKHRSYCDICQKSFKGVLSYENHKRIFHSV